MGAPGGREGHHWFEELAVSHVLGGLDEAEGRIFRAHLLDCPSCRARVGELRAIAHDLADAERDERRVRAARAVETKRRSDDDEPEVAEATVSPRASRILTIVGLIVVMLLSAWNFTLRGRVEYQTSRIEGLARASQALQDGEPWTNDLQAEGVDGIVSELQGDLALLVRGLGPGTFGVYLLNETGDVEYSEAEPTSNGRLFMPLPVPDETHSVVVTRLDDSTMPDTPQGERVFVATSAVAVPQ